MENIANELGMRIELTALELVRQAFARKGISLHIDIGS